jgi:hypothetical protein
MYSGSNIIELTILSIIILSIILYIIFKKPKKES